MTLGELEENFRDFCKVKTKSRVVSLMCPSGSDACSLVGLTSSDQTQQKG